MLEFPEVFYGERPDPLEAEEPNRVAWMDAFIGNPPFLGGKRISTELGDQYSDWLSFRFSASKNADLCAHFFTQMFALLGSNGAFGLIATNTIAQGDTRIGGLKRILDKGGVISEARKSVPWPGAATVEVSVVHVARGTAINTGSRVLDGRVVETINSRLLPRREQADPVQLHKNADKSFVGNYVMGEGFVLSRDEADRLIAEDRKNALRLFMY